jgi:multiple sugar transport system substrate-binding protein/alpha-glucoside transport system substrate-binding protein
VVAQRKNLAIAAIAAASLSLVAACSGGSPTSSGNGGATTAAGGGAGASTGTAGGSSALKGQSYTILGQWTGGEQKAFQAVVDAFDAQTGATGHYTPAAGGNEAGVLGTKVAGGTPPDIAILSLPGAIAQYASSSKIFPVSSQTQQVVQQNFSPGWGKLGSYQGKMYCVPVDASDKSTVWYNATLFQNAGLSGTPATWADLVKDSKALSASGVKVPVSIGGGDGWTLTDWFENVYLRTAGVDKYDALTQHKIKWTDPSVGEALTTLKQIWGDQQLIGSPAAALKVPFPASVDNVFKANPTSGIVYEASFVATTITGDKDPAKVGEVAKVFPFPSVNGSQPVVEAAGDFGCAFTQNPAAEQFLAYLAGPDAAKTLVSTPGSGFLSVNKNVPASAYTDTTSADLAQQMLKVGDNFRFDMSDQAPAAFGGTPNQGEWADLQAFLSNGNVKATQQQLEKDAAAAYK